MDLYAYDWRTAEITEPKNFHTELRIYCKSVDGKDVCVRVEDCKTSIIVEFTDFDFLEKNFSVIRGKFEELIWNPRDRKTINLVRRRKLYGAYVDKDGNHRTWPYVEITFSSRIGMFKFRKQVNEMKFPCAVKFHHMTVGSQDLFIISKNLDAAGWIRVQHPFLVEEEDQRVTRCDQEMLCLSRYVSRSDRIDAVDMKTVSWDIEARCKTIGKDPGAHVSDKCYQISVVVSTGEKYLLTLGPCDQIPNADEVREFETEKELILGFPALIREIRPNIITGWNIFTFDYTFLVNRAKNLMCEKEFLDMGMKLDTDDPRETAAVWASLKWSSKAFSTTDIKYVDMEGVLNLDHIEIVRRTFKLDSYKLNSVAQKFLMDQKDDMTFEELIRIFNAYDSGSENASSEMAKMGKYCVQDSKLVLDLMVHLKTWLSLSEMSKTTSTPIMTVHLNGQQKKFFNQVLKECLRLGVVAESDAYKSKQDEGYAGAYVIDPVPGLYEYVVPLDFSSLYPSIIIAYNLDYSTFVPKDGGTDLSMTDHLEWEDHLGCKHDPLVVENEKLSQKIEKLISKIKTLKTKLESSKKKTDCVLDPISGKAKRTTRVLDASLIDSLEKEIDESSEELKKLRSLRSDDKKKIRDKDKILCGKRSFYFLKKEFGRGIVPTIIQNLLDARKSTRNQMKSETDPVQLEILNQRQLSYKICANSMYGAMGVRSGALPFMPVAMCVTYIGRLSIIKATNIIPSFGGTIVYGDTDSNYVTFDNIGGENHSDKCEKIWTKALEVAAKVSEQYPDPMKIEFEEVIYSKFMILTKKRYMYYKCSRDGTVAKSIGQKGVLLARRDRSLFEKKAYEDTVIGVFEGKSEREILDGLISLGIAASTNDADMGLFRITKSVNDYDDCKLTFDDCTGKYKMGSYAVPAPCDGMSSAEAMEFCKKRLPAQVQLELKIIGRGQEKAEGARLEFVVLEKRGCSKVSEKIEQMDFFLKNKDKLRIDVLYYISHVINPVEQIFEAVFGKADSVSKTLKVFKNKKKVLEEICSLRRPTLKF